MRMDKFMVLPPGVTGRVQAASIAILEAGPKCNACKRRMVCAIALKSATCVWQGESVRLSCDASVVARFVNSALRSSLRRLHEGTDAVLRGGGICILFDFAGVSSEGHGE